MRCEQNSVKINYSRKNEVTFYITPTVYLLVRSIHKHRAILILSILYNQNLNKEGYTRGGQSSVFHILIGAQIEDQLVLCNKPIYRIGFAKYLKYRF